MRDASAPRNTWRLARGLPAALAILSSGGCATAIRGTTQDVAVVTDPPGATCTLASARRDEPVVRVASTPATATIRRDSWSIAVRCGKPGHVDARENIDPAGQGDGSDEHRRYVSATAMGTGAMAASLGVVAGSTALALGGSVSAWGVAAVAWPVLVGVAVVAPVVLAVDAMTGTSYGYPPVIFLDLTPASFPGESARDAWFAANDRRLDTADDALRKDTEASCWAACYTRRNRDEAFIAARRARYASDRAQTVAMAGPDVRGEARPP